MQDSVAATLKEARTQQGFDISAIAEITHVRKEYLLALEDGRYQDLPEDIYARNFLRLYAQALGLDDNSLLDRYSRERRSALGITPSEVTVTQTAIANKPRSGGTWIITALLLAALAWLVYFAYSRNLISALFNPRVEVTQITEPTLPTPPQSTATLEEEVLEPNTSPDLPLNLSEDNNPISEPDSPGTATEESLANPANTPSTLSSGQPTEVSFTLITDPPGADASIDNYPFATRTPVFAAPVTVRAARVLRIELEGYQPYEELLDVLEDTSLSITLQPIGAENTINPNTEPDLLNNTPGTPGQLSLQIEAETWLEVYQSTERGSGERLYYGTAQSGETLTYNLPVYVHVGNAAGIRITENGREIGLMGSSGEVTGRAFGQASSETQPADSSAPPTQ